MDDLACVTFLRSRLCIASYAKPGDMVTASVEAVLCALLRGVQGDKVMGTHLLS